MTLAATPPITPVSGIGNPDAHSDAQPASVWDDDNEAFVDAWNNSPDMRRVRGHDATRRRGGLERIARRACPALLGEPLPFVDARDERVPRELVEAAHLALRVVAGYDPDHAEVANGIGFAKSDVALGHALASAPLFNIERRLAYAALLLKLAERYRRQVPARLAFRLGYTNQDDFFDA
jgi:hypothetical protein